MARRSMLSSSVEVDDNLDHHVPVLPDGFVPGTVAPFVMRHGTGFLIAMQRAAAAQGSEASSAPRQTEPA